MLIDDRDYNINFGPGQKPYPLGSVLGGTGGLGRFSDAQARFETKPTRRRQTLPLKTPEH